MAQEYPKSKHSLLNRKPNRGSYDVDQVHAILDSQVVCFVSFIDHDRPVIIPSNFGRVGNTIYLHGAKSSRMLQKVASGEPVCICVTSVDGLVLARSLFNHSVNYRSVVCFGKGELVTSDADKMTALEAVSEQTLKGRWYESRLPNKKELDSTAVVAFTIEEATAKVRADDAIDDDEDLALRYWAGVVPMSVEYGEPQPAKNLASGIEVSGSVMKLLKQG